MDPFARTLAIETWTLYLFGICSIRLPGTSVVTRQRASRRIARKSWKKLQTDDYLMLVILITFTGVVVSVNETAQHGSNYIPPEKALSLTEEEREDAIYGSKMTFILEHFTLVSLWLVKACLLIIYNRLTLGLREHLAVKVLAVYVAASFVIVEILFCTVWCGPPITMYWDVPTKDPQCATYYDHLITTSAFNISSDLMMLCIPIPLVLRSRIPLKRQESLDLSLSLTIDIILMAILNRYVNFTEEYTANFLRWYVAEVATAVYVANVPLLWPLLRELFSLSSFANSYGRQGVSFPSGHRTTNTHHSRLRSRLSHMDESMESIVQHSQPDHEKGGFRSLDRGLELSPIQERHYHATATTEDVEHPVQRHVSHHTSQSLSGIFRTVEVVQTRE
ncbi:hypothetical protein BDV37DRAFT_294554 [Aspergillus pseudonomiae]|uniref:Rhodopsin domain-containing protein n=1 Tax=Aspergillus pseudonomiae TaxID=1506151 RepID=A0A5N7DRE2_9EURO|nr:uncharacterized protein BDV37DRAFT_294554 [Aspergillus pseudonomiae]KAE8409012.1 hypothetical protein BDV37DRAFT_294554 [Aspergillus pseudonomiae]